MARQPKAKKPAIRRQAESGKASAKKASGGKAARNDCDDDESLLDDPKRIALFATPVRVELVTAIQALGGAATVAELAVQLGKPADGLYYHLRALVRGGVLRENEGEGATGRSYELAVRRGQSLSLRYRPGATANARSVAKVATSMSRLAQRDFLRALARADTVVEGPARELWAARLRGWVDGDELAEVNRLLRRLADLLLATRPAHGGKLVALQWMLAPLDVHPPRRAEPAPTRSRRRPRSIAR